MREDLAKDVSARKTHPKAVEPLPFDQVLWEELDKIEGGDEGGHENAYARAHRRQLVGLAFSGGGIRSATFNLGVLQALAKFGLLRCFHYLSTVSGGGYIGSWFSAWLHRERKQAAEQETKGEAGTAAEADADAQQEAKRRRDAAAVDAVQMGLQREIEHTRKDKSVDLTQRWSPVTFLRRYSNYLTPRSGLFSIDTWTAVATYLRNLLLNLTVLVLGFAALLLVPRLLAQGVVWLQEVRLGELMNWPACALILLAICATARCLERQHAARGAVYVVVLPLALAALLLTLWAGSGSRLELVRCSLGSGVTYLLIWTVARFFRPWHHKRENTDERPLDWRFLLPSAFLAGAGAGAALSALSGFLQPEPGTWVPGIVWGPPAVLGVFVLAGILHVGLMGRAFAESYRQWGSRVIAWFLILGLSWLIVFAIVFYGRTALEDVVESALGGLGLSWIGATAAGLMAGRRTSKAPAWWVKPAALLGPPIFVLGLLVLVCCATEGVLAATWLTPFALFWMTLIGCLALASRIDVNEFSMHYFYRTRLIRAYLGASRAGQRKPSRFTGFAHGDDVKLHDLREEQPWSGPIQILNATVNLTSGQELAWQERQAGSFFFTPYHYGFNPGTFGSDISERGFRRVAESDEDLTLGTALAISGAALNPNMGYKSSASLAFLMTVFNARLGWWFLNPSYASGPCIVRGLLGMRLGAGRRAFRRELLGTLRPARKRRLLLKSRREPRGAGPLRKLLGKRHRRTPGLLLLLQELLGQASAKGRAVNLADGGFFDNLGIYELVRRRCRFILACDAEADPTYQFNGLGNTIRKCRSDFGIDIRIQLDPIRPAGEGKHSQWHCAIGKIVYSGVDAEAPDGTLVYLKASLTGDEPEDLRNYSSRHPDFPHEPTADQWFGESQFESYRTLGYHEANTLLETAGVEPAARDAPGEREERKQTDDTEAQTGPREMPNMEQVFLALRRTWYPPSEVEPGSFTHHTENLVQIYERLRSDKDLAFLDQDLSLEIRDWKLSRGIEDRPQEDVTEEHLRAGFFLCSSMLQLMENVYVDLNLERDYANPDNRGWMNLFTHWASTRMIRQTWGVIAPTYGARFQAFCSRRLHLNVGMLWVEDCGHVSEALPELRKDDDLDVTSIEERLIKRLQEEGPPDSSLCMIRMSVLKSAAVAARRGKPRFAPRDPPNKLLETHLQFTVGIAALGPPAPEGGGPREIRLLRVRNHLRKLGLGRDTIVRLVVEHKARHVEIRRNLLRPGEARYIKDMFRSVENEFRRWDGTKWDLSKASGDTNGSES